MKEEQVGGEEEVCVWGGGDTPFNLFFPSGE